jgi:uncharacterized protein
MPAPLPPPASRGLAQRYPTAFVTGASAGLGEAFVRLLLDEGVRVWGTSRRPERLAAFAEERAFYPVTLDLADRAAAERAYARAAEEAGGAFDLVILNAGYGVCARFHEAPFSTWEAQFEAMIVQTLRLTHATLVRWQARRPVRGCLVHVSSLATEFPLPCMSGYNAAKAALSAMSESLIFETRGTGVTVIDFRPGDYRTSFNQAMTFPTTASDDFRARVWARLEENLARAPEPGRAAADLRRALKRGRSGVVRSGSWFQAVLAPAAVRLLPLPLKRAVMRRYFGVS